MATQVELPSLKTQAVRERKSPTGETFDRLLHHRSARAGMVLLGFLVLVAIFAPLIAPYDPIIPLQTAIRRSPPCFHILGCPQTQTEHIMGVDSNFRDLFSRIVFGSRLSLQIGFSTITFAIIVGGILGALAGYLGAWVDSAIMRTMDVLMAFPSLLLAIAIVSVLGPGLINALLAIGIVSIPVYARLIRASILEVKEREYITAASSIGVPGRRILLQHILPNALTPMIVQGTLGISTAILDAAALSFLGLGAEAPKPEWGLMLGEERNSIFNAPHLVFFPGIAIMITVLAFNLLGDGLRDAMDPRLRGGS